MYQIESPCYLHTCCCFPRVMIFTSEKAKSWPLRHNLLVHLLLSMVRLSPSQLLPITIFTGRKAKTANNVLNRKVPGAGTPASAPPRYNFYERKSEKLAVASQSAGISATDIPTVLYGTSVSKLATPNYDFYGQKSENG